MIKRSLTAAAAALAVSIMAWSPALAFHCPKDIKAIDAALAKSSLDAAKKAEVKSLRDKGESQHKAGKHKDSVGSLSAAMRIILNGM